MYKTEVQMKKSENIIYNSIWRIPSFAPSVIRLAILHWYVTVNQPKPLQDLLSHQLMPFKCTHNRTFRNKFNCIHTKRQTEPAPTDRVTVSSCSGIKEITVLPDSGADISAAGKDVLRFLDYYPDNSLPSTVIPRAVSGNAMIPLRNVPITLHFQWRDYSDDFHFFPSTTGAIIS